MCVQEVNCERRIIGGCVAIHGIGVDYTHATYSGVELVVPKTVCCLLYQKAMDSVCLMLGFSVKLLGGSWGIVLKYTAKHCLTHDFQLMTCASSSEWLPLYA